MVDRTYRYFDGEVLYPFGYGLSYTTFEYMGMKDLLLHNVFYRNFICYIHVVLVITHDVIHIAFIGRLYIIYKRRKKSITKGK